MDSPLLVDCDSGNRHDGNECHGASVVAEDEVSNGVGSEGSSDESGSSPLECDNEEKGVEAKSYDWSTDDSSDDHDDTPALTSIHGETENKVHNLSIPQGAQQQYRWSSDESDDDVYAPPLQTKIQPAISEFESAIDYDDDDDDDNELPDGAYNETDRTETTDDGLQRDVENNLNVLSQLFPDLKDATPKHVGNTQESAVIG
ncbi:hypothetical protein MHU86_853 [Fragilaria crotonensis]|nr:hypothetical protein MHU86_853 [Fragilaria crotonensis]